MKSRLNLQERKVIIIGLLSLIVATVTYGVLSSSGAFTNEIWNLGGAIVGFLASVFALNSVYGKGFLHLSRSETQHSLESMPFDSTSAIELIDGTEEITDAMIKAVQGAQKYIYTVGGKSRNDLYLDSLRTRVSRGDIRYVRIITGDHIRHQLCKHLQKLGDKVEIGYFPEDKYGNVLVTHDTTFLALPSPSVSVLDKGLRIQDDRVAADYRAYVAELLGNSKKDISLEFIQNLCKSCKKENA